MSFATEAPPNAFEFALAASEASDHLHAGWHAVPGDAQRAVQVTLEERAWLARLGAAAIEPHPMPELSAANGFSS